MPYADTAAMNKHLAEIAQTVAKGAHALLIIDGAGWHSAQALVVPDNITLMRLPPYSPELNPQENIWQYLRQTWLSNRVFESYDDICTACCDAWKNLLKETGRIKSIASREWATTDHDL